MRLTILNYNIIQEIFVIIIKFDGTPSQKFLQNGFIGFEEEEKYTRDLLSSSIL